jgi:hypothetical protein
MRHRPGLVVLAIAVTAATACSRPRSRTDAAPADAAPPASATASAPPPPRPVQKPIVGLLCESDEGLWRLRPDGGTDPVLAVWPSLEDATPRSPSFVREGSMGPDGSLYVSATPGILRVGDPMVAPWWFRDEGEKAPRGDLLAFGSRPGGRFALWGSFHLFESPVFPPARKEDFTAVALPAGVTSLLGVAYDARDRLWVATTESVHVRDGDTWTKAELPAYPSVKGLVVWQGVAHVLLMPKLAAYPDDPTAPKIVSELPGTGESMLVGKRGIVVLLAPVTGKRAGRALVVDGAGQRLLPGELDRLIAHDGRGIVWGRNQEGFVAIEGDRRTVWPKGSIPAYSRAFVRQCHVAGSYETLPVVSPVRRGAAKGVIVKGGKPVANARIDLCEELPIHPFSTRTPCGGYGVSGKTDAAGAFSFEKVPIGKYHVVVDLGDRWKGTGIIGSSQLPTVTEGGVADYESISLD